MESKPSAEFLPDLSHFLDVPPLSQPEPVAVFTRVADASTTTTTRRDFPGTCGNGRLRPPLLQPASVLRRLVGTALPEAEAGAREHDSSLRALLDAVVAGGRAGPAAHAVARAAVVTLRHNLNKVVLTAFPGAQDARTTRWAIDVEALGSTIYLGIVDDDGGCDGDNCCATGNHDDDDDDDAKKWQEQCSRWGLGFERVATVPVDDHHHSSGRGRYSCTSPCLVAVRTRAGAHRLVVGAEVDAFDGAAARAHGDDGSAPLRTTAALVELKTHGAARRLPDAKLARVWVQAHLAGVPAVVVGHRDRRGVLCSTATLAVADIPRAWNAQAPARHPPWHPRRAVTLLAQFVSWLRAHVAATPPDPSHCAPIRRLRIVCTPPADGDDTSFPHISTAPVPSGSPLRVLSTAYINFILPLIFPSS